MFTNKYKTKSNDKVYNWPYPYLIKLILLLCNLLDLTSAIDTLHLTSEVAKKEKP